MYYTHQWLVKQRTFVASRDFKNLNSDCVVSSQKVPEKDGNMVTQLMWPSNGHGDSDPENNNYFTSTSINDILCKFLFLLLL